MKTFIWRVKTAMNTYSQGVMNIYHVSADTLQEAVEQAQVLEQKFVDEVEEEEGEKAEACVPISVEIVCRLDS